jgi:hypothetical protein
MASSFSSRPKLGIRGALWASSLIAVATLLQPQSANALNWESKTAHIELTSGEPRGTGQFHFTNNTATTVKITAMETSCECTVAQPEKRTFAPGEKGTLPVFYSSKGNTGRRTYVIAVTTDEDGKTVHYLKLVVDTYPEITVTPRTVVWENGEERTAKTVTVRIDANSGVKLTGAAPDRDVVAVELEVGDKPGQSVLRLTPKARDTIGQARIRLSTEPKIKDSAESLLFVLLR